MSKKNCKLSVFMFFLLMYGGIACNINQRVENKSSTLKISKNQRFFTDESGNPYFWLGDTGWLLFSKLTREEVVNYLIDRAQKGFNVIQVMLVHDLAVRNVYKDSALINKNLAFPNLTAGNSFSDSVQYDYWDNIEYVIDKAAEKKIYLGLVPIWGTNVRGGKVKRDEVEKYATFIANRFKNKWNIIWLNGGDTKGCDSLAIWNLIGNTLNRIDINHLITYHPYGRTTSSLWFHNEKWLDFNMFQSGHRRYDQDDSPWGFGQDNWRYVKNDYSKTPVKPTIDGEPSYEGIPQGLHDTLQAYWTDNDIRRYAYWSVFAGAAGFTYGSNAVTQFYKPTDKKKAYGAKEYWYEAMNAKGSFQMQYLKKLVLSRPYFERIHDQNIIAGENGEKYNYIIAAHGSNYAFIYTYTGRDIPIRMGIISGKKLKATWYSPRNGTTSPIGEFENIGIQNFNPPGEPNEGNDWVLILDSIK